MKDRRLSNHCVLNQTAAQRSRWRKSADSTTRSSCGIPAGSWDGQLTTDKTVAVSDFYTAHFPSGGALTVVANYADWQLGDDEPSLLDEVSKYIDARNFTHAIYSPHHDKSWFYGECEARGAPLDGQKFGFSHEKGCELTPGHVEDCTRAAPLFQLLSEKLPRRVTLLMAHISVDEGEVSQMQFAVGDRAAVWLLPTLRKSPCTVEDQSSQMELYPRRGHYTGRCLDLATSIEQTRDCVMGHACVVACDQHGCHLGPGVAMAQVALLEMRAASNTVS